MFSQIQRRLLHFCAFCGLLLLPVSCANTPSSFQNSGGNGRQLIVTMTVQGQINPNDFYFVLFRNANDPNGTVGPIPVIAAPWGNGFAGGDFTHFVRYDATQPSSGYGVYSVVPGSTLRSFTYLGAPVQATPVQTGGNTIQFQIPLSQLATTAVPADSIDALQINFLNTNLIPVDPTYSGTKEFDALGDARQSGQINAYITIRTGQAAIYNNSKALIAEPSGDVIQTGTNVFQTVSDPDLDIVNWSVEVRTD